MPLTRVFLAAVISIAGAITILAALPSVGRTQTGGCPGNLIFTKAIKDFKDRKIGELNVYYDPGTGVNCARTMHAGRTWGVEYQTSVHLRRCHTNRPGASCDPVPQDHQRLDIDNYKYYAGPVKLNARGECIWASGKIGNWKSVHTRPQLVGAFCN